MIKKKRKMMIKKMIKKMIKIKKIKTREKR